MQLALAYLTSIVTTVLPTIFLTRVLNHRFRTRIVHLAALIVSVILNGIRLAPNLNGYLNGALGGINFLILAVLFPLVCFRDAVWRRLLFSLIFHTLLVLCDGALGLIFSPIYGTNFAAFPSPIILSYLFLFILSYTILATFCVVAARTLGKGRFRLYYLLFILLPASQYLIVVQHFFSLSNLFLIGGILLGIAADLALFIFAVNRDESFALAERLRTMEHTTELEQQYYESLAQEQQELSLFRHDFNNHLAVIHRLIAEGDHSSAKEMIQALSDDLQDAAPMKYCANPSVNALLTEKQAQCRARNLRLEVTLNLPENPSVTSIHLCSILSNLLDNAMNGAEAVGMPNPTIKLTSALQGDYLFLKTENPYSEQTKAKALKTKGHGYGSEILSRIAETYGGSYQTDTKDGVFTAVVSVLVC